MDILVLTVNKVSLHNEMHTGHIIFNNIVVVIYILPKITQPPRNTSGNLYSTVNLTCRATGNPIPTILWYKNDMLFPNDNNDPSVLMFTELFLNDRGFYHCEAKSIIRGRIISVNSSSVILNISGIN